MKAIRQFLKPTIFTGLILIFLVMMQKIFFGAVRGQISGPEEGKTEVLYGIGHPLRITIYNGVSSYTIRWPILLGNLTICYLIAATLARITLVITRSRRPVLVYGITTLTMMGISLAISTGLSKAYWGYFFTRPPVLQEINSIATVTSLTFVVTEEFENWYGVYSIADRLSCESEDKYYCLFDRFIQALDLDEQSLLALAEQVQLPSADSPEIHRLAGLLPAVEQTGILVESEPGYDSTKYIQGIVIEAISQSGETLVFVGLRADQVSNDHYPYYEMVFSGTVDKLSYIRGQHFFYDLTGFEGWEWYAIWQLLVFPMVGMGFVGVSGMLGLRRLLKKVTERPGVNPIEPSGD